jgi:hypothetical protein
MVLELCVHFGTSTAASTALGGCSGAGVAMMSDPREGKSGDAVGRGRMLQWVVGGCCAGS